MVKLEQEGAHFGCSVSTAGDVDGDGYSDVIIGADYYDNGQTNEGAAFVYRGSATGINKMPSNHIEKHQNGAYFGNFVTAMGDVNKDGFDDVLISANNWSNGQSNEGAVFLHHGFARCLVKRSVQKVVSCDSYTWSNGITYYTDTNNVLDTFISYKGCDSIVTLNLTINHQTIDTQEIDTCAPFVWTNGVTYFKSSNVKDTFISANGCDSIVLLDLHIEEIDKSVIILGDSISAIQLNCQYQWLDCQKSMEKIIGNTSRVFRPAENGTYAVELIKNSCKDTSSCMIFQFSNSQSINKTGISIYPNPTTDKVFISTVKLEATKLRIKILNNLGKEISNIESVSGSVLELDVSQLVKGVYYVNISDYDEISNYKLIIQ